MLTESLSHRKDHFEIRRKQRGKIMQAWWVDFSGKKVGCDFSKFLLGRKNILIFAKNSRRQDGWILHQSQDVEKPSLVVFPEDECRRTKTRLYDLLLKSLPFQK
jgi:hypothetical protein